jgi:predicted nucleotidyltransferase
LSEPTLLQSGVRRLIAAFRTQLAITLGRNLVGAYLFGSIAFPGFEPRSGDIDFYVVLRRPLEHTRMRNLDTMHRILSDKFRFGKNLDGFYITLRKARKRSTPARLPFAANGRLHKGGRDDAWALHRQHLRRGACIILHGPKPVTIVPSASWDEIKKALIDEISFAKRLAHKYSFWSVLSLCRIMYTLRNREVVVSKIQAAQWATRTMPREWKPLIQCALRAYLKKQRQGDQRMLMSNSHAFLRFASDQIAHRNIRKPARIVCAHQ